MTPADVFNNALDLIGRPRIGSFYDGTPESVVGLDVWGQTRDEVLALRAWDFAQGRLTLTPSSAPKHPWLFRYLYPADAVTILDVMPYDFTISPTMRVQQWYWQEYGERDTKSIHTMFGSAEAVVTRRFLDTQFWPADFTALVVQSLAHKLSSLGEKERGQRDDRQQRA